MTILKMMFLVIHLTEQFNDWFWVIITDDNNYVLIEIHRLVE